MPQYCGPPPGSVRIEPLDALTLVYHRPAAATHLLAEPAPQVLSALGDGCADVATLLARLAAHFELEPGARAGIAAHLEDLVAAGLVTRA